VQLFLCAKYVFSTEINHQSIKVYSDKVMRESSISENGVEFQNGRKKIHDDNCTGRPDRHIKDGWDLSTSGDMVTGNRLVSHLNAADSQQYEGGNRYS
jgi:hypothetical protein